MSCCRESSDLNTQWQLKGSVSPTLLKTYLHCFHLVLLSEAASTGLPIISHSMCVCVCAYGCVCVCVWLQTPHQQCWSHLTPGGMKQWQVLGSTLRSDRSKGWKYRNKAANLESAVLKVKFKCADVVFSPPCSQINYYWSCCATEIIIKNTHERQCGYFHFSVITHEYTRCVLLKKRKNST